MKQTIDLEKQQLIKEVESLKKEIWENKGVIIHYHTEWMKTDKSLLAIQKDFVKLLAEKKEIFEKLRVGLKKVLRVEFGDNHCIKLGENKIDKLINNFSVWQEAKK